MPDHRIRMPEHKFHVDQVVDFFPRGDIDHKTKGQYTIVRLLPMDGHTPQYRIKNKGDGHERMVREHELGSRKADDSSLLRLFGDNKRRKSD
jgi:hypothetical protein